MTELRRLSCPTCGALFGEDATRGATRCGFCGCRATAAEPGLTVPHRALRPVVERAEALLALRRTLLAENAIPRSLRGELRPVDTRLVYVPFYVVRAIRTGVLERPAEVKTTYETVTRRDGTRELRSVQREVPTKDDRARVVLTDVERTGPAVRRSGWGLEGLGLGGLLGGGAEETSPDTDELRRTGAVLAADVEPSEIVERLRTESMRGETELHVPSVRIVLVPVWRIRYQVRGGLYDATVEALEGRLLAARAPENDRHRVPLALFVLGLACLCVGWVLRFFVVWPALHGGASQAPGAFDSFVWIAMVLLAVLGMFGTYAWQVVRYDADRVYENGRLWAEYLNKPPSTALDRFWEKLFGGIEKAMTPKGTDD
jgi:hypothetical protein